YKPFFAGDEEQEPDAAWQDPGAVAALFRAAMERLERDELRRGVSLAGPQRDDVRFIIDGADARTYASQGQQRTAVLAVKLAELDFLQAETGEHRSEEHTSELQSRENLVCRLLLEKKKRSKIAATAS